MDTPPRPQKANLRTSAPVLIDPEDLLNLLEPVADIVASICRTPPWSKIHGTDRQDQLVEEVDNRLITQIPQASGVPSSVRQSLIRRVMRVRWNPAEESRGHPGKGASSSS